MQKAINLGLAAAVALLGAGLAYSIATRPEPGLSQTEVESLLAQAAADQPVQSPATPPAETIDTATIGPVIEDYLLANPRLLERMSIELETQVRAEESERARIALAALEDEIYNDPANIVLGNPDGDVTLVEMFDYNCGYCRQVVADVMALVEEDPNLRVILKEFPILSQSSVDAARIAILVGRADVDYQDFHTALFSARGQVDTQAALAAAESLGLSRVSLELEMTAPDISDALQRTYTIAQALGISGTPTFIIGDEVIPGALPKADLVRRIEAMRECGSTVCTDSAQDG
ncbi:DsbA family protein [uncultured Pelagibacterium sp.]|uniref:DsbA family protein n=1 Tax=uncultured Pelagibacterium sp. TaxID=1159875 RepID=UPI0030DA4CC1|tara:strand:+ start:2691 stop:3563 length:873 start_codon:yes stop_codon:yes gene_type:complete